MHGHQLEYADSYALYNYIIKLLIITLLNGWALNRINHHIPIEFV